MLAPTIPSKIVCVGMNYAAHAAEIAQDVPDEPLMFFKPSSSIIGPGDSVVLPRQSSQVELEIELAVVIGKLAKNISKEEAKEYIWGFTIANDVTARDLQFTDLQFTIFPNSYLLSHPITHLLIHHSPIKFSPEYLLIISKQLLLQSEKFESFRPE